MTTATNPTIVKLKRDMNTVTEHLTTIAGERATLMQHLHGLDEQAQKLTTYRSKLDRKLALIDGRHTVVREKRKRRHPLTPEQRANRKSAKAGVTTTTAKPKTPPTVEELLALIAKIPPSRRKKFISKVWDASPAPTTAAE